MFGFLKEKLKKAVSIFSRKTKEETEKKVDEKPEIKEEPKKVATKEKLTPKIPDKKEKKPEKAIEIKEEKILQEEKQILREEKQLESPKKEEIPADIVEEEVKEILKEEQEKKLEAERIDKELEEKRLQQKEEKKGFFGFFKSKKEEKTAESKEKAEEKIIEKPEEKKGFFSKVAESITTKKISQEKFEELFWDLELALLENNVAVEVIEKIKDDLKQNLVDKPLQRTKIDEIILETLQSSIKEVLTVKPIKFLERIKEKKPFVICFVGINGSGKTTSIAKIAHMLKQNNITSVMAAADTFRAAAIDQLQHHADKLNIKLIRQDYGADPAAVAFDAIKHAETKKIDVVLIDTAGRMHSNTNLVDEMKKIIRVAKPDLKIFVGESITGNDCVEQAKEFNEAIGIDGIILSKADVDEKGGAALSVSYITKKPIIYIGTGQEYKDIKEFSSETVLSNLGLQ
jgi:fused signal recognition particle receptor